jgi:hypothetical protein
MARFAHYWVVRPRKRGLSPLVGGFFALLPGKAEHREVAVIVAHEKVSGHC